jgi:hypothetical protein
VISGTVIISRADIHSPVTLQLNKNNRNITLILLEVQSFYEVNGALLPSQNKTAHALDLIAVMPPQEQRAAIKKKYHNKAPRLWTIPPYPAPVKMIRSVVYNSLPEG